MGPAAGISFAVLRINRATLRLDPRFPPRPSAPSLPPVGPSTLPASLVCPALDLSINLLYPLCAAPRIPTFVIRPCYVVVIVVVFFAVVVIVPDVAILLLTRRRHASSSSSRMYVLAVREKFARYVVYVALLRRVDINLSLTSGLSIVVFLFPRSFVLSRSPPREFE